MSRARVLPVILSAHPRSQRACERTAQRQVHEHKQISALKFALMHSIRLFARVVVLPVGLEPTTMAHKTIALTIGLMERMLVITRLRDDI